MKNAEAKELLMNYVNAWTRSQVVSPYDYINIFLSHLPDQDSAGDEMCFHACPECDDRCNCADQPCSHCAEIHKTVYIIQHRETMLIHGCFDDRKQAERYIGNGNLAILEQLIQPLPKSPTTK